MTERMKVNNDRTTGWTDWEFRGDEQFNGQAALAERILIPYHQASRMGGRHCGIARFVKSKADKVQNWINWYDEAFYIIRGKGRFTRSDPPYDTTETYDVGPGDYFYIPSRGARLCIEPLGDEPFEWFYCAGFNPEELNLT